MQNDGYYRRKDWIRSSKGEKETWLRCAVPLLWKYIFDNRALGGQAKVLAAGKQSTIYGTLDWWYKRRSIDVPKSIWKFDRWQQENGGRT